MKTKKAISINCVVILHSLPFPDLFCAPGACSPVSGWSHPMEGISKRAARRRKEIGVFFSLTLAALVPGPGRGCLPLTAALSNINGNIYELNICDFFSVCLRLRSMIFSVDVVKQYLFAAGLYHKSVRPICQVVC